MVKRSRSPPSNTSNKEWIRDGNYNNNVNGNINAHDYDCHKPFLLNLTHHHSLLHFIALRRDVTIVEESTPYHVPRSDCINDNAHAAVKTVQPSSTHQMMSDEAFDTVLLKKQYLCVPEVLKLVPEYVSQVTAMMKKENTETAMQNEENKKYPRKRNKLKSYCFETFLSNNSITLAGSVYPSDPLYLLLLVEAALIVSGCNSCSDNNIEIKSTLTSNTTATSSSPVEMADVMIDRSEELLHRLLIPSCPIQHCWNSQALTNGDSTDNGPFISLPVAAAVDIYSWPNVSDTVNALLDEQVHGNGTVNNVKGGSKLLCSGRYCDNVRDTLLRVGRLYDFWKINSLFSPSFLPSTDDGDVSPPIIITSMDHLIHWRKARETHTSTTMTKASEGSQRSSIDMYISSFPSLSFHVAMQLITYECTGVGMLPLSNISDAITCNTGVCIPFLAGSLGDEDDDLEKSDDENDTVTGRKKAQVLNKQRTEYWKVRDGFGYADSHQHRQNGEKEKDKDCVNGVSLTGNYLTQKGITTALCLDPSVSSSLSLQQARELILRGGVSNAVTSAMLSFSGVCDTPCKDTSSLTGQPLKENTVSTKQSSIISPIQSKALLKRLSRTLISLYNFTALFGPLQSPFCYNIIMSQSSRTLQSITSSSSCGKVVTDSRMEGPPLPSARWYIRTGVSVTAVCIDSFIFIPKELGDILDTALQLLDTNTKENKGIRKKSRNEEEEEISLVNIENDPIKQYRDILNRGAVRTPTLDITDHKRDTYTATPILSKAQTPLEQTATYQHQSDLATEELLNVQVPFPIFRNNKLSSLPCSLIDLHRYGRTIVVQCMDCHDESPMMCHKSDTSHNNDNNNKTQSMYTCPSPHWLIRPFSVQKTGTVDAADLSNDYSDELPLSNEFVEEATRVLYASGRLSSILTNDEIETTTNINNSNNSKNYNNNTTNNNNMNNSTMAQQTERVIIPKRQIIFTNVSSTTVTIKSIIKDNNICTPSSFPLVSFSFSCDVGDHQNVRNVFYVLHGPRVETERHSVTYTSNGGPLSIHNNNNNNDDIVRHQLEKLEEQTMHAASTYTFSSLALSQHAKSDNTEPSRQSSNADITLLTSIVPTVLSATQLEDIRMCLSRHSSQTSGEGMTVVDIIRGIPAFNKIVGIINDSVLSAEDRARMMKRLKDTVGKGLKSVAHKVGNKGRMPMYMLRMG